MPWIRPLLLTVAVALLTTPAPALAGDLTTRDVIELSRSGLGDEVIIALVEVDGGPFHLSPADVLDLKAEGLSDRVLAALVRAGRHSGSPSHVTEPLLDDGVAFVGERHVTYTVAVPVPVYVPVYNPRPFTSRRHDRPSGDADPEVLTPGIRRGPVTPESIRHAPPGFHPGTVRARTDTASETSARPVPQAPQAPSTPGIARSTRSADRPPTPGVARRHQPPDR